WRCRSRWRCPPMLADERERMVEWQLRRRGIEDERVLAAMARVPRELFLPPELQEAAYADAALPIGDGQTISQPYMVALICDQLEPRGRLVVPVGGPDGQWLEVVVRTPEGPAILRTVPCRFVPLVAGR